MKMIKENKQQSRLRHYIGAPKRFLRRARDLYVDSLVTFDGKVSSANIVACPTTTPHLPKNHFSSNKDEVLDQMYRAISDKGLKWNNMEYETRQTSGGYGVIDRSYSVALGQIGRIDEEEACEFHERVTVKGRMMFPRCRSHAVTRDNGCYY